MKWADSIGELNFSMNWHSAVKIAFLLFVRLCLSHDSFKHRGNRFRLARNSLSKVKRVFGRLEVETQSERTSFDLEPEDPNAVESFGFVEVTAVQQFRLPLNKNSHLYVKIYSHTSIHALRECVCVCMCECVWGRERESEERSPVSFFQVSSENTLALNFHSHRCQTCFAARQRPPQPCLPWS